MSVWLAGAAPTAAGGAHPNAASAQDTAHSWGVKEHVAVSVSISYRVAFISRDGHGNEEHLFGCRHIGVFWAGAAPGSRAAGHLLGVGQRAALHLGQDAFLVQLGFQKASVAIKLHQVENLPSEYDSLATEITRH